MISKLKRAVWRLMDLRGGADYVKDLIQRGDCHTALDIGCGHSSLLSQFRPALHTVGLDASEAALNLAKIEGQHDDYIAADISKMDTNAILKSVGGRPFDLTNIPRWAKTGVKPRVSGGIRG